MEMVKMESERNRGKQGWMDGQEFKTDISRDKRVKKTVSLLIQPSVLLRQRCVCLSDCNSSIMFLRGACEMFHIYWSGH